MVWLYIVTNLMPLHMQRLPLKDIHIDVNCLSHMSIWLPRMQMLVQPEGPLCGLYHVLMLPVQVHTILQSQTESLHNSMGMVREAIQSAPSPAGLGTASGSRTLERDCSDQLLETWMLLEYCDQGNLESAARESRFRNDFVSALTMAPVTES